MVSLIYLRAEMPTLCFHLYLPHWKALEENSTFLLYATAKHSGYLQAFKSTTGAIHTLISHLAPALKRVRSSHSTHLISQADFCHARHADFDLNIY